MKRSQTIEHIKWLLDSNHPINSKDTKYIAEDILAAVEWEGMRPPVWVRLNMHHGIDLTEETPLSAPTWTMEEVEGWEPED